jgi:hypothetical protein
MFLGIGPAYPIQREAAIRERKGDAMSKQEMSKQQPKDQQAQKTDMEPR